MNTYVHGYSERESERLRDQADAVRSLLHHDTRYPAGSTILEAGCGVGAQTTTLARNSPGARFVSVDISPDSLGQAVDLVEREGIGNVVFQRADVYALPFREATFDHVFVCFLLEHLVEPTRALAECARVLRPGGTITAIEGDHGSCYFHPETQDAVRAWRCLIEVQARLGGDALIGRRLLPLLDGAGFRETTVSPRMVYCDRTRPGLVDGFVRKTIIPMVEGVHDRALADRLIDREAWARGIRDFHAVADRADGTFCYAFFKAVGTR